MSDFKIIGMNALPVPEGYVGNLSDEHKEKLYEMWRAYFVACDDAKGDKKQGGGEMEFSEESDPTKLGIPQDDAAKEEAKKRMEEQGMKDLLSQYGSEALRDTYWSFCKADNPDTIMLRFLRARKWDVSRAMAMLATCLKWRLDSGVEDLARGGDYGNFQSIPKFSEQQNTGKIFAQGATANEAPICYVRLKNHFTFGQPASTMLKFIIYQMETWRLFMVPPNDKMSILFDLQGFGIRNCDVVALLNVVKCLEAYYPEALERMFIHRAPWIFGQVWKVIKGLLDPVVRNKIAFTSNVQDLNETIPSNRLLEWVKGSVTNDFVWIEPSAEENALLKETAEQDRRWSRHRALADEFEKLTRRWSVDQGNDPKLREQRDVLIKKLRLSQFELEPYTRGRTIHHRNGTLPLGNPGMVKWDYVQKDGEKLRQIIGQKESRKSMIYQLLTIQNGGSVADAEAKTKQMIEAGQWGQWDTCDDMPEDVKNQVEHLLKPGTEAVGGATAAAAAAAAPDAVPSSASAAPTTASAPAAANGTATAAAPSQPNGTSAPTQQNGTANGTPTKSANGTPAATQKATPKSNGPSDYKTSDYSADYGDGPNKKQSMFGSIKKKLMA